MQSTPGLLSATENLSNNLSQLSESELDDLIKLLDLWQHRHAVRAEASAVRAVSELQVKALNLKEALILAAPVDLTEEEALGQAMNLRKAAKKLAKLEASK